MPSVLLDHGMFSTSTTTTTTTSHPIAASQTTGPHPRSLHRSRSPRSSRRLPAAPPTGGVPAPPHRRSVAGDDGDRGVGGDRPLEAAARCSSRTRLARSETTSTTTAPAATAIGSAAWAGGPWGEHAARCDPSTAGRRSSARTACPAGSPYHPAGGPLGGGNVARRPGANDSLPSTCPLTALTRSQRTGDVVCEDRPMRQADGTGGLAVGGDDARRRARPRPTARSPTWTSTWPSSAPGTPACGRPTTSPRPIPSLRIAVIERDHVGFGASGRNGGWCSALLATELVGARRRHGRGRGDRHEAGDAGHRRRGRPLRRRRRGGLRQGRARSPSPARPPSTPGWPRTSTRPGASGSARTTSAG